MDGQAESAPESGGIDDLASFLADTPETESTDEDEAQDAENERAMDAYLDNQE